MCRSINIRDMYMIRKKNNSKTKISKRRGTKGKIDTRYIKPKSAREQSCTIFILDCVQVKEIPQIAQKGRNK